MSYKLISHVINGKRFFIYKITNLTYRKRLVCILHKDLRYVLSFNYKEVGQSNEIAPFFSIPFIYGIQFQKKINLEQEYEIKMKTEEECRIHIACINQKRKMIEDMLSEYNDIKYEEYCKKCFKKQSNQ